MSERAARYIVIALFVLIAVALLYAPAWSSPDPAVTADREGVTAGGALAARPLAHLVRRTYSGITARAEWGRWIRTERAMAGIGEPAGWMTIASAGIETIVLWGATGENLQRYPCLSIRSLCFDQNDVVKVVAAHSDTHFRRLGEVKTGDGVRIHLKDRRVLQYRICDTEVVPRELTARRVADKDGEDWLVLITCHPFSFAGAAPDRLLVWARPDTPPTQRAGGRPFSISPPPSPGNKAYTSCASPLLSGRAAPFAIPSEPASNSPGGRRQGDRKEKRPPFSGGRSFYPEVS